MHFTPVSVSDREIFLDARNAAVLSKAVGSPTVRVSLDLNLTQRDLPLRGEVLDVAGTAIEIASLAPILDKPRKAFMLDTREASADWKALQFFHESHYQLVPTAGAPTAEIDGIQMHCAGRFDPFEWADKAVATVVRKGDRIFETCGGLGYMAILAVRRGAGEVVSTEISEGMLRLRRFNPWSRLEAGLPIRVTHADAFDMLSNQADRCFETVIHDPPRFSRAPALYSQAFYDRAYAVLKPGGRMFHYTGSPSSRTRDLGGAVRKRLLRAGFRVRAHPELESFVATRPRS